MLSTAVLEPTTTPTMSSGLKSPGEEAPWQSDSVVVNSLLPTPSARYCQPPPAYRAAHRPPLFPVPPPGSCLLPPPPLPGQAGHVVHVPHVEGIIDFGFDDSHCYNPQARLPGTTSLPASLTAGASRAGLEVTSVLRPPLRPSSTTTSLQTQPGLGHCWRSPSRPRASQSQCQGTPSTSSSPLWTPTVGPSRPRPP